MEEILGEMGPRVRPPGGPGCRFVCLQRTTLPNYRVTSSSYIMPGSIFVALVGEMDSRGRPADFTHTLRSNDLTCRSP